MCASGRTIRWSIFKCLTILAGAAGFAPSGASAQDCKLSVHASPQVLYGEQKARVKVFAHFPAPPTPNAPYAFASAAFDVLATDPAWNFATDGVIIGSDVLGIEASQAHQPQLGNYADPSNPYRVWSGKFKPQSDEPALVEIEVDPTTFSVYPSELTSSSAECDAEGGNDYIFVNPLNVGRWEAAPGYGTTLEVVEGAIVNGLVYSEQSGELLSIGLIPSGLPNLRKSSSRIEFDGEPLTFTATVQILGAGDLGAGDDVFQWDPGDGSDTVRPGARRSRIGDLTVTFSRLETGGHAVGANFAMCDGSVRFLAYEAYLGSVRVASGDFNDDTDGSMPGLVVSSLPQTFETHAGTGTLRSMDGGMTWTLRYDQPVMAIVPGPNGPSEVVTIEYILIANSSAPAPAPQNSASNNLRQLSLGSHVFEAEGVQQMSIIPGQGD